MAAQIDVELCAGCGVCVDVCPAHALEMEEGRARVDVQACVECGLCVGECPRGAIRLG